MSGRRIELQASPDRLAGETPLAYQWRLELVQSWREFVVHAQVPDAQQQAILAVLYDLQQNLHEHERVRDGAIDELIWQDSREGLEQARTLTPSMVEESDTTEQQLRNLVSDDQLPAYERLLMPYTFTHHLQAATPLQRPLAQRLQLTECRRVVSGT